MIGPNFSQSSNASYEVLLGPISVTSIDSRTSSRDPVMALIKLETRIHAPRGRVFDLARSIDAHLVSAEGTGERVVAGRASGLMEQGERVTWEATHFFVRQRLTVEIVAFDRPRHFRDAMVRGAFRRFDHDHDFESIDDLQNCLKLYY